MTSVRIIWFALSLQMGSVRAVIDLQFQYLTVKSNRVSEARCCISEILSSCSLYSVLAVLSQFSFLITINLCVSPAVYLCDAVVHILRGNMCKQQE